MELKFEKWHGAKNDFIVVKIPKIHLDLYRPSLCRQARNLCDRHTGIGADGILVLSEEGKDHRPSQLTIINSDGSIARNCGNGLRCAMGSILRAERAQDSQGARLKEPSLQSKSNQFYSKGKAKSSPSDSMPTVELEVEGMPMICRSLGKSSDIEYISVTMPIPLLNEDLAWWEDGKSEFRKKWDQTIGSSGTLGGNRDLGTERLGHRGVVSVEETLVEVGNPHIVIQSEQMNREWLLRIGAALQDSSVWDGINVHGVRVKPIESRDQARAGQEIGGRLSSLFDVWVYERGVGETLACGSGAVAVGVAHLSSGLENRSEWVGIDMPGGRLYVKQESEEEPPILAGPAVFVFEGHLTL